MPQLINNNQTTFGNKNKGEPEQTLADQPLLHSKIKSSSTVSGCIKTTYIDISSSQPKIERFALGMGTKETFLVTGKTLIIAQEQIDL